MYVYRDIDFSWRTGTGIPVVSFAQTFSWDVPISFLTSEEISYLFEIYGPLPKDNQYSKVAGILGLGKTRVILANADQIRDTMYDYINKLNRQEADRVKDLISQWVELATEVIQFSTAERVRFQLNYPEEVRKIIKKRLQTYIPIYTQAELDEYRDESGGSGNRIRIG